MSWKSVSQRLKTEGPIIANDYENRYVISYQEPDNVAKDQVDGASRKSENRAVFHLKLDDDEAMRGGFGNVYVGERIPQGQTTGTRICLKQARNGQSLEALVNEIKIFDLLDHQHIIQRLFACTGSTHGEDFLGLHYFDGKDLYWLVYYEEMRGSSSSLTDVYQFHISQILVQQTDVIEYLQRSRIIHRDFTPANILYNERRGESKLIDFGLAWHPHVGSDKRIEGGTLEYLAPEALCYDNYNEMTDIYGLGATLCHLILMEEPWGSLDTVKVIRHGRGTSKGKHLPQSVIGDLTRIMMEKALKMEIERFCKEDGTSSELRIQKELMSTHRSCNKELKFIVINMLYYDEEERFLTGIIKERAPVLPRPDEAESGYGSMADGAYGGYRDNPVNVSRTGTSSAVITQAPREDDSEDEDLSDISFQVPQPKRSKLN